MLEEQGMERRTAQQPARHAVWESEGLQVDRGDILRFLEIWEKKGSAAETLSRYRRILEQMYEALPPGKRMYRDTLSRWQGELARQGYAVNTIRTILSVCNTWLDFMGRREYQASEPPELDERVQPELSRSEYLRLLAAAKTLGDERTYLLVKLFASTGLYVRDLPQVTLENVAAGRFALPGPGKAAVRIPGCLRKELLAYGERQKIRSGPLFLSKEGKPLHRSVVAGCIANLCESAMVPPEKGNQRCLRKLYLNRRADIESNLEFLIEQAMDRQLEQEQTAYGWET